MSTTLEFYQKNAQSFAESTLNVDVSPLYVEFEPLLPASGKILDAGCGAGRDLKYFKDKGFDVIGIDASENLVDIAKRESNCEVYCKTFEKIEWQNEFDGIWCCASLLHVAKEDQVAVFSRLCKALKKGGLLYVSFKYGSDEIERNGRWFSDLNEALLSEILSELPQLATKKVWLTCDVRPDREGEKWLNAIIEKKEV